MIRQYYAQRRRGGDNPLGVGVIAAGTIFYLQPEWWWRDRYRGTPPHRDPHIVEAFLNGTMGAARRNHDTGLWEDVYLAGRSDMAILRSLRDGRRNRIAVRTLILHDDHGLVQQPSLYPTLPDMRLWRATGPQCRQAEPRHPTSRQPCLQPTPPGSAERQPSAIRNLADVRPRAQRPSEAASPVVRRPAAGSAELPQE